MNKNKQPVPILSLSTTTSSGKWQDPYETYHKSGPVAPPSDNDYTDTEEREALQEIINILDRNEDAMLELHAKEAEEGLKKDPDFIKKRDAKDWRKPVEDEFSKDPK